MTGLRVLHATPGDLGSLSEWKKIISYAETGGTDKRFDTGNPVLNTIWISPFTTATQKYTYNKYPRSGSLYASVNHLEVDPRFSDHPNDLYRKEKDEKTLKSFCKIAAQKGILIMGDLVLNHVASDHPIAMKERSDLDAIQEWGKDIKFIIEEDGVQKEISSNEYCDGQYILSLSYISEGSQMPGEKREGGRYFYNLKFVYGGDLQAYQDSSLGKTWSDVAKINYSNPETKALFIQLWKDQVAWFLDLGISGFRCDAAYKIDKDVWSEIIQYSHDSYVIKKTPLLKRPIWIAETLGGNPNQLEERIGAAKICINGTKRQAFDDSMLWTHWVNDENRDDYMAASLHAHKIAHFGGLGVPENHDTEKMLSECFAGQSNEAIAARCFNMVIASALLGTTGSCIEYGTLKCIEVQSSIFDEPDIFIERRRLMEDRPEGHLLNIESRVWTVLNHLDSLSERGLVPEFDPTDYAIQDGKNNKLLRYTLMLREASKKRPDCGKMFVFQNIDPENGPEELVCNTTTAHFKEATIIAGSPLKTLSDESVGNPCLKIFDTAIFTEVFGSKKSTYSICS